MILGLVGAEGEKFTPKGEAEARSIIASYLLVGVEKVVSGGCHLGGIDIWAAEMGRERGIEVVEHLPHIRAWEGYKARNIKIAEDSDIVICITVDTFPNEFKGPRFPRCYHCGPPFDHVKSGGCWTMKFAQRLGKVNSKTVTVKNYDSVR